MIPYFHLSFAKEALISWNLLNLFCSPIITNHEHVFLRILVTNLRVLCSDIYAIPTICTPYSILYQKFALWTYSPFRHEVLLLYFIKNNLLRVLTYVCRHCNIKCFEFEYIYFFYFNTERQHDAILLTIVKTISIKWKVNGCLGKHQTIRSACNDSHKRNKKSFSEMYLW